MLTVITAAAIGRSYSVGNKADVESSSSSSSGIFDNTAMHPHGNNR